MLYCLNSNLSHKTRLVSGCIFLPMFSLVLVLVQIIVQRYHTYWWVAELIQVFIAISVTVSFLVMGSAMKHTRESHLLPPPLRRAQVRRCSDPVLLLLPVDGLVSSLWAWKLQGLTEVWERLFPNHHHMCSARRCECVCMGWGGPKYQYLSTLTFYFLFSYEFGRIAQFYRT